jgi:hypothetical protein
MVNNFHKRGFHDKLEALNPELTYGEFDRQNLEV